MMGYPSETPETIEKFKERLNQLPADNLRISFITPYPGTSTYDVARRTNTLTTIDWNQFNSDIPIIKNKMSSADLVRAREEVFRAYYFGQVYKTRIAHRIKDFPELEPAFREFSEYLTGVFGQVIL